MPDLVERISNFTATDHLRNRLNELYSVKAPFLVIVQSSGYGKTRTVLELCRERRAVYLLCHDIEGGLSSPSVIQSMIQRIFDNKNDKDSRERIASKMLECITLCASKYATPADLFNAQLLSSGEFGPFYSELKTEWERKRTPDVSPLKSDSCISSSFVNPLLSMSSALPERLIVIFDEAMSLVLSSSDDACPYRCIRRVLKPLGIVGIFLDTSAKIAELIPGNASSDRREGLGLFCPPILDIDTVDVFSDHLFTMGRPLWHMQLTHRTKSLNELVFFAAHKLCPFEGSVISAASLCALFVCRFGLNPRHQLSTTLVEKNLATLVAVSEDRTECVTKYLSEPILSEASAWCTTYGGIDRSADRVLDEVVKFLQSGLLECGQGERGEVAAAAALGYLADDMRRQGAYDAVTANMSAEFSAVDFLYRICGTFVCRSLDGFLLNFTHFYRAPTAPDKLILSTCWDRHAALYVPAGEEGIDLLIVMKKELDFATIRVQVKNFSARISEFAAVNFLRKLSPLRCVPRMEEPFSVALVLGVGGGGVDSICKEITNVRASTRSLKAPLSQLWLARSIRDISFKQNIVSKLIAVAGDMRKPFTEASAHCREGAFSVMVEDYDFEQSSSTN